MWFVFPQLRGLGHSAMAQRYADAKDGRITRVRLTADGEARLSRLTPALLSELRTLAPILDQLVARWVETGRG